MAESRIRAGNITENHKYNTRSKNRNNPEDIKNIEIEKICRKPIATTTIGIIPKQAEQRRIRKHIKHR